MEHSSPTIGDASSLAKEILSDAQTKAERTARRAQRDAQKVREDTEKEASETAEKVIAAARARAERETGRLLRAVHQEAKRRRLRADEQVLGSLFEEARRQLLDKRSYDYRRSLLELAAAAIGTMRGMEFLLHLCPQDAAVANPALASEVAAAVSRVDARQAGVSLSTDAPGICGGVIVSSTDGHQLFDNSFEARLARLRPMLRSTLAAGLFGQHRAATSSPPSEE